MVSKKQGNRPAASSVSEPSSALINWAQATTQLHTSYVTLQATITKRRQQSLAHPQTGPVWQCSVDVLEEVRLEMIQELNRLIDHMNEPVASKQEETERLRSHTLQLHKQSNRIQRIVCLSSLIAS